MDFKVGDKVRILKDCSGTRRGEIAILSLEEQNCLIAHTKNSTKLRGYGCMCEYNWELIRNNRITELRKRIIK